MRSDDHAIRNRNIVIALLGGGLFLSLAVPLGAGEPEERAAIPAGAILFFDGDCPGGFGEYRAARGRAIVATPRNGTDGGTRGRSLPDRGFVTHSHDQGHTDADGKHSHSLRDAFDKNELLPTLSDGSHDHGGETGSPTDNSVLFDAYGIESGEGPLVMGTSHTHELSTNGGHTHLIDLDDIQVTRQGLHDHELDATMGALGHLPYVQLRACEKR